MERDPEAASAEYIAQLCRDLGKIILRKVVGAAVSTKAGSAYDLEKIINGRRATNSPRACVVGREGKQRAVYGIQVVTAEITVTNEVHILNTSVNI